MFRPLSQNSKQIKKQLNSLGQIRQKYRLAIRREYIQQFTKNRRKKLNQELENEKNKIFKNENRQNNRIGTYSQLQNQYFNYLNTFNYQAFIQNPNQNLQYIQEIIFYKNCHYFKAFFKPILIIISKYVAQLFNKSQFNFERFKQISMNSLKDDLNQTIEKILIYNQMFYWPYNCLQNISQKKINLNLFLNFLLAILYEISIWSQEVQYQLSKFDNGYNNLGENQINDKVNLNQPIFSIYDSFLTFFVDLITIGYNINYQSYPLKRIQKKYIQIINRDPTEKIDFNLIYEFIFINPQNSNNIIQHSLNIIRNISAISCSDNQKICQIFIKQETLINFEYLLTNNPTSSNQRQMVAQIYSNLVSEQIQWYKNKEQNKKQESKNQIEQEQSQPYENKKRPGIYIDLLLLIIQTQDNPVTIKQICHILYKILQNYQFQQKSCLQKNNNNHKYEQNIFFLLEYQCKSLAQIIATFFNQIQNQDLQIQYLSNLFILTCSKFLSYILYMNKMIDILKIIIINQNKRIYQCQINSKKAINQQQGNKRLQKERKIHRQNLKGILTQCTGLLQKYYTERSNQQTGKETLFIIHQYGYNYQCIANDIILCIINLYEQNQLHQGVQFEFMKFILACVKYFPQHVIKFEESINGKIIITQKFLMILEQIELQTINHTLIFIQILQFILSFIYHKLQDKRQQKNKAINHIINFQSIYRNILQKIQGQMYREQNNINFQIKIKDKIQNIYNFLEKLLENTNLQMETQN